MSHNTRAAMMLLPTRHEPGKCPVCATEHDPSWPHNQHSLYYQYRFYGLHGRWPTWADALAHVTVDHIRNHWESSIKKMGCWSEPPAGESAIADPVQWADEGMIVIPIESVTVTVPCGEVTL